MRWMMMFMVACGGGGDSSEGTPDAPVIPVLELSPCPATVDASFVDSPATFVPAMATIPTPGFVKFTINAEHFVIPHQTLSTDPAINVARGQTKCLRFNVPGEYNFVCGVHGFVGKIVAQ